MRSQVKQILGQDLIERLWLGQEQVNAFLDNLALLFDYNQTGCNLRMLKVQEKGPQAADRACIHLRWLAARSRVRLTSGSLGLSSCTARNTYWLSILEALDGQWLADLTL
jgi:hypothetical protein